MLKLTFGTSMQRGYAFSAHLIHQQEYAPPSLSPIHFVEGVLNKITGDLMEYCHLFKSEKHREVWSHSFANEPRRLSQGTWYIQGTDTCFFILKSDIWLHLLQYMPTKRRDILHSSHLWWRLHQLPWQQKYAHRGPHHRQTPHQFHNQHAWRQNPWD